MDTFLSEEVRNGLELARKRAVKSGKRLCVHMDDAVFRVSEVWDGGFSMPVGTADGLRGLVDIYDGPKHLFQCLIVRAETEADQDRFEYKRMTEASDRAALDFVRAEEAPIALLAK
jgi:hypothetical protein